MESFYWKEFLAETASDVCEGLAQPRRLTLRRHEIIERNVIISFFLLRRMIELLGIKSGKRLLPKCVCMSSHRKVTNLPKEQ